MMSSNLTTSKQDDLVRLCAHVYQKAVGDRCCVSPSPELKIRLDQALRAMRDIAPDGMADLVALRQRPRVGFNDGLIVPGSSLPLGTPPSAARNVALQRAPLRGTVNVVVVLAEFSDKSFGAAATQQHFQDLFFSTGVIPTGSVREYFTDVTNNLVTISGEVVGPFTMPQTLSHYTNGESGVGVSRPNARDFARDAAIAANPSVSFSTYDNDGDGTVDAYVVIHAGQGAEQTGSGGDMWSHKWVLPSAMNADGVQLFAYLTVPEDARIGVCAHELGHLLFGFPDLYDTDSSSEGVGNWCLMGGGSWNGGGDTPAHPSAWCKANQGWATVTNITANSVRSIPDVKTGHEVFRMWKEGDAGQEYFLVENRQKTGYDSDLPGEGLCIWHIDDAIDSNSNEAHPKVALEQADGLGQLNSAANRGDDGDVFPGTSGNSVFGNTSSPDSKSYAGSNTCVTVGAISASAPTMSADCRVNCGKSLLKDTKEFEKPLRWEKPWFDEKPHRFDKDWISEKRPEKPMIDKGVRQEKPFDFDNPGRFDRSDPRSGSAGSIETRLAALESAITSLEPFIDSSMRPDLDASATAGEEDLNGLREELKRQGVSDKRLMDTPNYRR